MQGGGEIWIGLERRTAVVWVSLYIFSAFLTRDFDDSGKPTLESGGDWALVGG